MQRAAAVSDGTLRALVLATAIAQFVVPFQLAAVTPMLPVIGHDLHASAMEVSLINSVYAMSLAIFHLPAGRLGEMIGYRQMLLLGIGILAIMGGVLPLMPNVPAFLVVRFIQAVGTSMTNTAAVSLLTWFSPPSQRGQLLGTAVTGVFIGISIGPFVGGFLADTVGWRWLFYGIVPLTLLVIAIIFRYIPPTPASAGKERYDWASTLLWLVGIALISGGAIWCMKGMPALAAFGAGAVFLGIFAVMQYRADRRGIPPILDLKMAVHNPLFSCSSTITLLNYCTVVGQVFFYCLFLQFNFGLGMETAGLYLGAQSLMQALLSRPAGRLGDRYGYVNVTLAGLSVCTVALLAACTFGRGTPLSLVVATLFVMGVGLALFASPSNATIMGSVDESHLGQASGMIGTARTMGMLVSMVAASLSVGVYFGDSPATADKLPEFILAMQHCVLFYFVLNVLSVLMALYLKRRTGGRT